jgi:hypothetical protein
VGSIAVLKRNATIDEDGKDETRDLSMYICRML